jgi:hypothetical protein
LSTITVADTTTSRITTVGSTTSTETTTITTTTTSRDTTTVTTITPYYPQNPVSGSYVFTFICLGLSTGLYIICLVHLALQMRYITACQL